MNRIEALRILGLGEDAEPADIKAAYRETAQILHPDRFAGNKKLQERATEQFKNLQEAYEFLTKKKAARRRPRAGASCADSAAAGVSPSREAEGRLAGIAAARAQLVAQRDLLLDERRNGIAFAVIGAIVALVCGRRPFGPFGIVAAIAVTAAVWGIVQIASAQRTLSTLNEHIADLELERGRLLRQLEEEEGRSEG